MKPKNGHRPVVPDHRLIALVRAGRYDRNVRRVGGTAFGLLVLAAVALPAAAAPAERIPASAGGATANSMTFTDPAGDVPTPSVDITTVTVSNDDAGNLTFKVPTAPPAPRDGFSLYLATDYRTAAQREFGVDVDWSRPIRIWGPSGQVEGAAVSGRYSENAQIFEFNRSLLQLPSGSPVTRFDFGVRLDGPGGSDRAPDSFDPWSYEIKIAAAPPAAPKRVAITTFTRQPQVPVAGKPFKVAVAVGRVGRPGQFRGDVTCGASITGKKLRGTGAAGAGRASCSWRIPPNAARKTISGSIAVSEDGGPAVTRRFSGRIRSR